MNAATTTHDASLWFHLAIQETPHDIWLWRPIQSIIASSAQSITQLQAAGWVRVDTEQQAYLLDMLRGQLVDLIMTTTEAVEAIWAKSADIMRVTQSPVILGFVLRSPLRESLGEAQWVTILNELPPPYLGEVALVRMPIAHESHWFVLHSHDLTEEGKAIQHALAATLLDLGSQNGWMPYHRVTSTDIMAGEGTSIHFAALATASISPAHAAQQMRRQERWQQAQSLAQQLAAGYWQAYQLAQTSNERPRTGYATVFGKQRRALILISDPFEAVLRAFSDAHSGAHGWRFSADDGMRYSYQHATGSVTIHMKFNDDDAAIDDTTIASLWHIVRTFSDRDGDVILALLAHMLASTPDDDGYVWITSTRILEYRGIVPMMKAGAHGPPRRAGQRQEDLIGVAQCIRHICMLWLTAHQTIAEHHPKARRRIRQREWSTAGYFLHIAEVVGHQGEAIHLSSNQQPGAFVVAWRYRFGSWLHPFLTSPNRHPSWLLQQTLRYDPYREVWEKRLARYLLFRVRTTLSTDRVTITCRIGQLFDEICLPIDERNPERTKRRFERALQRLLRDSQIESWEYHVDSPHLPARKWLASWLVDWQIAIVVPTTVV